MLSNVAYRMVLHPLHHHHHPSRCLARHPRTASNLMRRPSLSLTLPTNSIQCRSSNLIQRHSPDLMSNFSPTAPVLTLLINSIQRHSPDLMPNFSPTVLVINVAHRLDPTSHQT